MNHHASVECRLSLARGDGLVVRRPRSMLFVPSGDAGLADAFVAATPGDEFEAVTLVALDREFDVGEFVVIQWNQGLKVAVFGAIDLVSDHRSLPRLTGAGSGTWVERTIPSIDAEVTIGVAIERANRRTDVAAGTVEAGGFELVLAPAGAPDPAVNEVGSSDAHELFAEDGPVGAPDPRAAAPSPSELASAVWGADSEISVGDAPLPTPEPEPASNRASMGRFELPGPAPRWRLVFADGHAEAVDRVLLLGRNPSLRSGDEADRVRIVALDCARISSTHLEVRESTGELYVTDLSSRNGSFMLTSGDGQPARLEAKVQERVDHGTHVQIGSQLFVVEDLGRA